MTDNGCQKNCSRSAFPYEIIVNRYECDCIAGYYRGGPNGECIKQCDHYGDSLLFSCPNDVESCCCPAGFTYTAEISYGEGQNSHTECTVESTGADVSEDFNCELADSWMYFRCSDALPSGLCDHEVFSDCYRSHCPFSCCEIDHMNAYSYDKTCRRDCDWTNA
jgi:hypothetical protein